MRRLYALRVRFHDWMWSRTSPTRLAARRLPLYFSDPYHVPSWRIEAIFETTSTTFRDNKVRE